MGEEEANRIVSTCGTRRRMVLLYHVRESWCLFDISPVTHLCYHSGHTICYLAPYASSSNARSWWCQPPCPELEISVSICLSRLVFSIVASLLLPPYLSSLCSYPASIVKFGFDIAIVYWRAQISQCSTCGDWKQHTQP